MKRLMFGIIAVSVLLTSAPTGAQQASALNAFVYKLNMGSGQGPGMDFSMAVTIQSTAPDGTRSAQIVVKSPKMPPLDGKKLDATISPAGAITIGSTGDLNKHYSIMQMKQMSEAATAPMMQMMIDPIGSFASGCAAAPSQKAGTSWHSTSTPMLGEAVYTITGREQVAGRDTIAVTFASPQSNGVDFTGKGHYDPAAHLVIDLHSQLRQSPGGPAQILDVAMGGV